MTLLVISHIVHFFAQAENLWQCALRSDTVVFELPDNHSIASVDGDFKIHFQDRHGDFSWYLSQNVSTLFLFHYHRKYQPLRGPGMCCLYRIWDDLHKVLRSVEVICYLIYGTESICSTTY